MTANLDLSRAALILVDIQEDFCPGKYGGKDGSLAVKDGREIAPVVNRLLELPFQRKIATQDWHPQSHISFASNHEGPEKKPFTQVTVTNPRNKSEQLSTTLWPDHCVQNTKGAEIIPEIHVQKLDHIVRKGQDEQVEMYSAFHGIFSSPCVSQSDLDQVLKASSIDKVYLVGIATDVCVKWTAIHAAAHGFETVVLEDACRPIYPERLDDLRKELASHAVSTGLSSDLLPAQF